MTVKESHSLYVIVPVFNEADNMKRLFLSFRELVRGFSDDYLVRFILVDDGSLDKTVVLAQKMAVGLSLKVLKHPFNQGPGKAFSTAFEYLKPILKEGDWVVTMEGDNTSRLKLLRQMFTRTLEGYDVILASPYMYGGGIKNTTLLRTMISHVANAFVKEFLGIHGIHTMSSFFRLYRGSVVLKLQIHYGTRILERTGFESMVELLLKLIYLEVNISEVPMVLDTSVRKGSSKMRILRTICGYLTLWKDKKCWCLTNEKIKMRINHP